MTTARENIQTTMENESVTATCQEFCPQKEKMQRQKQRRVHFLERPTAKDNISNSGNYYMVKEYSRPAAGKSVSRSCDLRPPQVLLECVQYLTNRIMTRTDCPWSKLYIFVFDRMRAIRQDLTIQRASCDISVAVLEIIARFHVYSGHKLCEEPIGNFDPKINRDHANECLHRLLYLYRTKHHHSTNRAEIETLYILYNLGSAEALHNALRLPRDIRLNSHVQLGMAISHCFLSNNFVRLVRLAQKCNVMFSCALHHHLPKIRREALCAINAAFPGRNLYLPLHVVQPWLMFDSIEGTHEYCEACGLTVTEKGISCKRSAIEGVQLKWPATRSKVLVESKMTNVTETLIFLGKDNSSIPETSVR